MSESNIINLGRTVFGVFFLAGNICFFGYVLTKEFKFADYGFLLIIFGAIFNFLVLAGLLTYAARHQEKCEACVQAVGFLLLNIPIAALYAIIGWNLIF
ncbi:hypothetical protein [Chryseobacterium sp.]|uniref:hypothetical protein n=1 Tax=Chryseobacterium sp. TaxID=1871047 RepID=UPI0032198325